MSTPTEVAGPPVIIQSEDIRSLPVGIVVNRTSSRLPSQLYIKTGDSVWSTVAPGSTDDLLQKLVGARSNSVSPHPEGPLEVVNSEWNLNILVKAAVQCSRAVKVSRGRQRVLEQRNENARRALEGLTE